MEPTTFTETADVVSFLEDVWEFGENRVYLLAVMARPKENASVSHNDTPMFREIVTREEKIKQKVSKLRAVARGYEASEGEEFVYRLYGSVNARDVRKSMFQFQKEILDYEKNIVSGHTESAEKVKRLDKEWESVLQRDGNKEDQYFVIDVDEASRDAYECVLSKVEALTEVVFSLKTPNGFHIIVEPFNYTELDAGDVDVEVKTDNFMFLRLLE
jgi:hypothetical protein